MNLGEYLERSRDRAPRRTAVACGGWRLTYAELDERANRVANAAGQLGLRKGDRCAVWMHNRGEFIEIYFGLARAGVVAVPINFRFTEREAAYVLGDARPAALLFEAAFAPIVAALRDRGGDAGPGPCVCVDGPVPPWALPYETWLASASPARPRVRVDRDDTFFIGYTSGTTGFPKGAVVTQGAMIDNDELLIGQYGGLDGDDVFMTLMPLFHSNSTWFAQTVVMAGATNVISPAPRVDAERTLQLIADERVTVTSVVPTILSLLLAVPAADRARHDLRSLRAFLCGSAPLPSSVKEAVVDGFHAALHEGYGATETGIVTSLPPSDQRRKGRSVGRVVSGKEIVLLGADGRPVATGDVGELWVRGTGVLLKEYWGNPDATAKAFRDDGWCGVGDMGRVDSEGYYYLVDRKHDMIISGGENIYPSEVEDVLMRHPAVREVAVVGVPDALWGEAVRAVVVLRPGERATPGEIVAVCEGQLARYKRPRSVEFVSELPKNPTGKILRRLVRAPYWAGHDRPHIAKGER